MQMHISINIFVYYHYHCLCYVSSRFEFKQNSVPCGDTEVVCVLCDTWNANTRPSWGQENVAGVNTQDMWEQVYEDLQLFWSSYINTWWDPEAVADFAQNSEYIVPETGKEKQSLILDKRGTLIVPLI